MIRLCELTGLTQAEMIEIVALLFWSLYSVVFCREHAFPGTEYD